MKVIVIGAMLSGMQEALRLRQEGHEVEILATGSCLMQEIMETWRYSPLPRQESLREMLIHTARQYALPLPEDGPVTPAKVKRLAAQWMQAAGIPVRYYTRFAGVSLRHGRLCGVLAVDKSGLFHLPCQRAIDAQPYGISAAALSGVPVRIPEKTILTLRFEICNIPCERDVLLGDGTRLFPTGMGEQCAIAEKALPLPATMSMGEVRRWALQQTAQAMRALSLLFPAARTGSALPLMPDIDFSPGPASVSIPGWNNGIGETGTPEALLAGGIQFPWRESAGRPVLDGQGLPRAETDLCVVGMGTAGIWAAICAQRQGISVLGIDMLPCFGGTRTLGGVIGLYYGNRSALFGKLWRETLDFAEALTPGIGGTLTPVAEMLYYEAQTRAMRAMPCTMVAAVQMQERVLRAVLTVGEEGWHILCASQFIDATGDGDLAVLCGCSFEAGDAFAGVMQNYSQWYRCASQKMGVRSIDQDVMDPQEPSEWARSIETCLAGAKEYDLYDLLSVRESRRLRGRMQVTLPQIIRDTRYFDVLCEAFSTYDPHSRCMAPAGRMGMMPALGRARFVGIPLRAVTFDAVCNLMVAGKALSMDQEAFNYIRMSTDVRVLGWLEGFFAAQCVRENVNPAHADLRPLQAMARAQGALTYLPPMQDEEHASPERWASAILCGNRTAFHEAILAEERRIVPLLQSACDNAHGAIGSLAYRALLYFGDARGAAALCAQLDALVARCGTIAYSDHQGENGVSRGGMVDDTPDDYWEMNQLAYLLARAQYVPARPVLLSMMRSTIPAGPWRNDTSGYARIRLDCQTVPNFDRIWCLAECALLSPSAEYGAELARLYAECAGEEIAGATFYRDFLLLKLACALKACDHPDAQAHLAALAQSRYSMLRKKAVKERL